jgi:hypothetical protein
MSTAKFNTWVNPDGTENYKCRAWVNFNGTGTVAIRASGNVSSITDGGTGIFQVNLTTAMPDAGHAPVGICSTESTGSVQINSMTSSAVVIYCRQINANVITFFDPATVTFATFR